MNNEICICFITDNNYVDLTKMCIWSIIKNRTSNRPIKFYILGYQLSQANLFLFHGFSRYDNISIYSTNVDLDSYIPYELQIRHCTKANWMDFLIPELPVLRDLNRVLYIDPDIIVRKDLSSLYDHDLHSKALGCVKDFGLACVYNTNPVDMKTYTFTNAGVILMDIKKLQEKEFTKHCLENVQKTKLLDQDIINELFKNDICFLEPKYNFSWHKTFIVKGNYAKIEKYNELYGTHYKSLKELENDSVIWHFHGDKNKMLKEQKVIKDLFDSYLNEANIFLCT